MNSLDVGNVKVLTRTTTSTNPETGELLVSEETLKLRTKKREKFMLVYVENFNMIVNLRKKTQELLAIVLARKVTYGTNEVVLDSFFRAEVANNLETSRQVINNSITELVEKNILNRKKNDGNRYTYFLNPYLFGQGEWNTIEKQRQQFTIDYDFVNYKATKELKTITAYEGLPDKENIQVLSMGEYVDESGVNHKDALIEDKKIDIDVVAETKAFNNQDSNSSLNLELEILKEKNRARELEIKELEAKNRARELEIEQIKIEKGDRGLF